VNAIGTDHVEIVEDDVTKSEDPSDDATVEGVVDYDAEAADAATGEDSRRRWWPTARSRVLAFWVLPVLVLLLAAAAGFFKWQYGVMQAAASASVESVAAARDSTIALLSYQADTAGQTLPAARDRLTGKFLETYTQLANDVVIPGAAQQHVSVAATVPAAASVSATQRHAVVLLFVNQTSTAGAEPPSESATSVRVTLDKIDGRWLISEFEPV
jgi:Mce-associated membrane protein